MKILKSILTTLGMSVLICLTSCTDWGQMDNPAGNQVYPTRQVVATYSFDYGDEAPYLSDIDTAYSSKIEVIKDYNLGSNVLHIDSTGYARIANPLKSVSLQNGAAITMWVKTATDNLSGALFSFGSESADSARFYFTRNAELVYTKPGQLSSLNLDENNPASYKTNAITAGEWHFIALQISSTGYQLYVDGNKSVSASVTNPSSTSFNYATLVKFLNNAAYMYLGKGSDSDLCESWYDNVNVIRNQMIAKDWAKPTVATGKKVQQYQTFGAEDNTAGWWTTFTPYMTSATSNCEFHYSFTNYTDKANNWDNWVLVLTNGKERGADGYTEYVVLRSDAFGWGTYYDGTGISSDYDWTTFASSMDGAKVDLTVRIVDGVLTMTAVTTTTSGTVYHYTYTKSGLPDGVKGTFLTMEKAHLVLDTYNCSVGQAWAVGSNRVGKTDFSSGWWSVFSVMNSSTEDNCILKFRFVNHTDAVNNWDNWVQVTTNGNDTRDSSQGYLEYLVMRSDAFGWGTYYNSGNITNPFSWDTFKTEMNGATVDLTVQRINGRYDMTANVTSSTGKVYTYTYYYSDFPTGALGVFLTIEEGYLDILSMSQCPLIFPAE